VKPARFTMVLMSAREVKEALYRVILLHFYEMKNGDMIFSLAKYANVHDPFPSHTLCAKHLRGRMSGQGLPKGVATIDRTPATSHDKSSEQQRSESHERCVNQSD